MPGTKVADAYVSIIPETKGFGGKLKSTLNGEASSAGDSAGGILGGGLAKKLIGAFAALKVGEVLVNTIKKSFEEGAALEQSIGGIRLLFGEESQGFKDLVSAAESAYKTTGLTANQYMEQVSSFSASLISSLGGDTDKAAKAANSALTDMADNAAAFGTDMQSIQNAYQGFAKQNYTMLDNLKLGYGGTKTEMQRLLADAEAFSGVHYDIDNLADVYEAIHVVQNEMGLADYAAKEAATTFSGSANAVKAAWSNVLGVLSGQDTGGMTVETAMQNLGTSVSNFLFNNFFPMLGNIIKGIPALVKTFVTQGIPMIIAQGKELLQNIVQGFRDNGPAWHDAIVESLNNAITWIQEKLPEFLRQGLDNLQAWIDGWGSGDGHVAAAVGEVLGLVLKTIGMFAGQLIAAGFEMLGKLIAGFIKNIPNMLSALGNLISNMFSNLKGADWGSIGRNIIDGIVRGITAAASALFNALKNLAKNALNAAKEALSIHSPSRVFADEVGQWIPAGMAVGIEANTDLVDEAMRDLSGSAVATASYSMSGTEPRNGAEAMADVVALLRRYLPECANTVIEYDGREVGRMVARYV